MTDLRLFLFAGLLCTVAFGEGNKLRATESRGIGVHRNQGGDRSTPPGYISSVWLTREGAEWPDEQLAGVAICLGGENYMVHIDSIIKVMQSPIDKAFFFQNHTYRNDQPLQIRPREKATIDVSAGPIDDYGVKMYRDAELAVVTRNMNGKPFALVKYHSWHKGYGPTMYTKVDNRSRCAENLEWETDKKKTSPDGCYFESWSRKPASSRKRMGKHRNSDDDLRQISKTRHWTRFKVGGIHQINGTWRIHLEGAPHFGPCGGPGDLGAPVICNGKLTYLLHETQSSKGDHCSNTFDATHAAEIYA